MHTHCTCGENGNIFSSYPCCTSDFNYQEQVSVPQHVVNNKEVKMTDNFIDLFSFRTKIERGCRFSPRYSEHGLHISNCMSHKHYNGANMKGQKRVYKHIFPQSLLSVWMREAAICILKTV
jgi:hypothetical protein